MPIYAYRCGRCKEHLERLVPMSTNSATAICPNCGTGDARKQLSTFAAIKKGISTSRISVSPLVAVASARGAVAPAG